MNGPSQEIALAMVGLLYKVKDSIVKIALLIMRKSMNIFETKLDKVKVNIDNISTIFV